MVTQKQIKAWIPEALAIFQRFMPPFPGMDTIPIPEIHIVSDKTVFPTRKMLVAKLRSRQTDIDEDHYTSIMEMIHGDLGDAILIWQKYIPDPQKIPLADDYFCHYLWHELGHYYAIHNECRSDDLHRFNNPGLAAERAKQEGYWMWSEFIAEAIALYVEEQHCRIDNKEFYHPELLKWEPNEWGYLVEKLLNFLEMAFCYYPSTIDEAGLAMYFATLLMDDATKRYVKAASEGKLRVYDKSTGRSRFAEPGSIEATCISDQAEAFQDTLWQMKRLLEIQLRKESFWEINAQWLEELGQHVIDLMNEKIALLASMSID